MIQTAQVGVGIAGREGGVWGGACFFGETASQVGILVPKCTSLPEMARICLKTAYFDGLRSDKPLHVGSQGYLGKSVSKTL